MSNLETQLLFDPICGMWLEPQEVASTYTYLQVTYAFCCGQCRDLFARAPEFHVAQLAHEPRQSAGYRCPHQC
ncbi:MAG: YHS domain-containing protein [Anaerolineae bacterium]|nr:YHS domain-containing protein [Anaerolineae bacterium]